MPALPLPFVVALVLAVLLLLLPAPLTATPVGRSARLFLAACVLLALMVGLRWSLSAFWPRMVLPVAAASLPPIAWRCFATLSGEARPSPGLRGGWPHFLPVALVLLLVLGWRQPLDLVLALLFFGYGGALIRLGSRSPDQLAAARLSMVHDAGRAIRAVGWLLILFGLNDLLVALDFELAGGHHAPIIVAVTNVLTLIAIAATAVVAMRSVPAPEALAPSLDAVALSEPPAPEAPEPAAPESGAASEAAADDEDRAVMAKIDQLLRGGGLFRDPDLTLDRLARRAVIPARRISAAINRLHGRNVSQVVNEYRIEAAKVLLATSDLPVTSILFEVGFQTKSNFNREFRRVTAMSPSEFRATLKAPAMPSPENP